MSPSEEDKLVEVIADALRTDPGGAYGRSAKFILETIRSSGYLLLKGWQPIETAPKDGTSVLVSVNGCSPFDAYWEGNGDLTTTDRPGWCDHTYDNCEALLVYEPTLWMPLPLPPVKEEKAP